MEKKSFFDNTIVSILIPVIIFLGITYFNSDDFPVSDLRKIGFKMDKYPDIHNYNGVIEVFNCPNILYSRTGINSIDWSRDYDFKRLNKRIYKLLLKHNNKVKLNIKLRREDSYGNEYFDNYTVGYLDPSEAKKYNGFNAWERSNDLEDIIKNFQVGESENHKENEIIMIDSDKNPVSDSKNSIVNNVQHKENDILVATINNPDASTRDLMTLDLTLENTQLLTKEVYLTSPYIQEKFKNDKGEFDKPAFDRMYELAASHYNLMSDEEFLNSLNEAVYDPSDITRPRGSQTYDVSVRFSNGSNPK